MIIIKDINPPTFFFSQVAADVFNAPVFVQDIPNSASLGGAFRAKHVIEAEAGRSFQQSIDPPFEEGYKNPITSRSLLVRRLQN